MQSLQFLIGRTASLSAFAVAFGLVASANGQGSYSVTAKHVSKAVSRSLIVGRPSPSQVVHVTISLSPPNQAALEAYAKSVGDPTSSNYRNFLSPAQFGARFGQPAEVVQEVEKFLTNQGFKITTVGDNNLFVMAEGTVSKAENAFRTRINQYRSLDRSDKGRALYFSNATDLQVPTSFASRVSTIDGLDNHVKPIARSKKLQRPTAGSRTTAVTQPLIPSQTSVLYNMSSLHSTNHWGQNRTIGISNFDGYDLTNLSDFYKAYNLIRPASGLLSNVTVKVVGTPNSSTEDPNNPNGSNAGGEADLDMQMVAGQAPLANIVIYDSQNDLVPVLEKEANDNICDVITESYGWPYDAAEATTAHNAHLQLTAQGITYFLASGDDGTTIDSGGNTYGDYDTEVTNVGGTVATISSNGTRQGEVGWFGSAGGWLTTPVVPFNTLPSWQKGTGVPTNINFRLIPDVALHAAGSNDANADNGAYQFYYFHDTMTNDGYAYSGTSFSSPIFAAGFALTEQALIDKGVLTLNYLGQARFGRINELIYGQNGKSTVWHDITSGTNGNLPNGNVSNCTPGWDFVTGWGSVDFQQLTNSFAAPTAVTFDAISAAVYGGFGGATSGGIANLNTADSSYYSIPSVSSIIGPIASPEFNFTVAGSGSAMHSLTLNLVMKAPAGVSAQVYLFNYSTGIWNLMNTTAMTGSNVSFSVSPYFITQFLKSDGTFTAVIRADYPSKTGAPFTLQTDLATVTTLAQAP